MVNAADERPSGASHPAAFAVVAGLLFPLAYILSVGPADALMKRGYIKPTAFAMFYRPVIYIYDHVPVLKQLIDWYLSWWI